ncbi:MAG: hypothetical protein BGO87_02975 [Flavobacteriia bacterium 40-80]|nr:MAG: hypothetical protein BGO87_02975 [Flavobacteriia bacterium 40-80]
MGIITLTTDLGLKDHYVATLKGKIYSACPNAVVIDISHHVNPFNIIQAAYYVNGAFRDFPEGTVHVIGVKSEPVINIFDDSKNSVPSIMKFENQYFISNDNGFFGLLLKGKQPQGFWNIDDVLSNPRYMKDPTKFMLIPAACNILNQLDFEHFATPSNRYCNAKLMTPVVSEYSMLGKVVHVDNFGNLITNISKEEFYQFGEDVPFVIKLKRSGREQLDQISGSYGDVEIGNLVALFNLDDVLEIGINQAVNGNGGGASKLLGLTVEDEIYINFVPRGSRETLDSLF